MDTYWELTYTTLEAARKAYRLIDFTAASKLYEGLEAATKTLTFEDPQWSEEFVVEQALKIEGLTFIHWGSPTQRHVIYSFESLIPQLTPSDSPRDTPALSLDLIRLISSELGLNDLESWSRVNKAHREAVKGRKPHCYLIMEKLSSRYSVKAIASRFLGYRAMIDLSLSLPKGLTWQENVPDYLKPSVGLADKTLKLIRGEPSLDLQEKVVEKVVVEMKMGFFSFLLTAQVEGLPMLYHLISQGSLPEECFYYCCRAM